MAKDDFIGIRVTKEFKKFIQREAKRKACLFPNILKNIPMTISS